MLRIKLWLEKAGEISDYAEFGIRLRDNSFELLESLNEEFADVRRQNEIELLIRKGVVSAQQITLRAAQQWRLDLEDLPAVLGYSSLSEFFELLSGNREKVLTVPLAGDPELSQLF